MLRYCTQLHLIADAPEKARADLDATHWAPPGGTFHIQHWLELEAKAELALYEGTVAKVAPTIEPTFQLMKRSLLTRVQMLRSPMHWLLGRLVLARGGTAGVARRVARLRRERVDYARVFAALLGAGLEAQRGDPVAAQTQLEEAITLADRHHMQLHAAMARFRLAQVRDRAPNTDELDRLGVHDPDRLADVYAPGF